MVDQSCIKRDLEVVASCGTFVGRVDAIDRGTIRLTEDSPGTYGHHRYIPLEWVRDVDGVVRLSKPWSAVTLEWLPAAVGAEA